MVRTPGSYPATPVPTAAELRMLNRMGTGYLPSQLTSLRAAGGPAGLVREAAGALHDRRAGDDGDGGRLGTPTAARAPP